MTQVKFCGLTRHEDAEAAVSLGASFLGVIFAGGPRRLDPARARTVLAGAPAGVGRVGVFGAVPPEEIARTMEEATLTVAQLHGDPDAETVSRLKAIQRGRVWAVIRVAGAQLPPGSDELFEVADAVVLDARVDGQLGGTGVRLDWAGVREGVARMRGETPLVLAGGLTPGTVGTGIAELAPQVVDVSSGVESAPGIKDHARMRAFVAAVSAARQGHG